MICLHHNEIDERVQFLNKGKSDAPDVLNSLQCKICGVGAPDVWRCLFTSPNLTCHVEVCSNDLERHAKQSGHNHFFNISTLTYFCNECQKYSVNSITLSRMFQTIAKSLGYHNPKERTKRFTGIKNLGNTCFVGTALQCIARMLPIQTYLRKDPVLNQILDDTQLNTLIYEFREILKKFWTGHIVISPDKFIRLIPTLNQEYAERDQQDVQEFFRLFFDNMDSYLTAKTGKTSIISESIKGTMVNELRCHNCQAVHKREEEFGEISLAIPQEKREIESFSQRSETLLEDQDRAYYLSKKGSIWKTFSKVLNLYDCLLKLCSPQDLIDEDNLYFCSGCQTKAPCTQQYKIKKFPDILIVNLKRRSYSRLGGSKISTDVITPFTLKLDEFSEGDSPVYNLSCIIQHVGDIARIFKGHYLAYFRDFDNEDVDHEHWYECDDKNVTECTAEKVRKAETYVAIYTKFPVKRHKIVSSGSDIYIPKEWLYRYYSLSNPGPVNFNKYYCSHSFLSTEVKENDLLPISRDQWETLKNDVGCKGEPIIILNTCEQCSESKRRLDERIEFEKGLYDRVKNPSNEFPRFIIAKPWIKNWESFVLRKSSNPPGQIKNKSLFYDNGSIKDMLRRDEDYIDTCEEIWLILNQAYGSDTSIIKTNGDIYSDNVEGYEEGALNGDTEELISRLFSL